MTAAFVVGLLFFALNIWAGIELWQGRTRGFTLSIVAWAFQIPKILAFIELYFYAGPYVGVSISDPFNASIEFGAQASFLIMLENRPGWEFGINLLAIGVVILLSRLRKEQEEERELLEAIALEERRMGD